jgi:shikimate kinase
VPTSVLWERTRHDRNRPLLQVPNPRERIESLYRERDPLYRAVADIVIDGGRGNPGGMVRQIEKAIEDFRKNDANTECRPG